MPDSNEPNVASLIAALRQCDTTSAVRLIVETKRGVKEVRIAALHEEKKQNLVLLYADEAVAAYDVAIADRIKTQAESASAQEALQNTLVKQHILDLAKQTGG